MCIIYVVCEVIFLFLILQTPKQVYLRYSPTDSDQINCMLAKRLTQPVCHNDLFRYFTSFVFISSQLKQYVLLFGEEDAAKQWLRNT